MTQHARLDQTHAARIKRCSRAREVGSRRELYALGGRWVIEGLGDVRADREQEGARRAGHHGLRACWHMNRAVFVGVVREQRVCERIGNTAARCELLFFTHEESRFRQSRRKRLAGRLRPAALA